MSTKKEIATLTTMKLNELQAKFAEVVGEKTRCPNRKFLIRKICEALQATSSASDETSSPATTAPATEMAVESSTETAPEKLTKLTVTELQDRYLQVVGRPTASSNSAYLIWKIREARKGRITIGPRKNAQREGVAFKVLPLRMETTVVDKLDEAWKRIGLSSRMELFRRSLRDYLSGVGEGDVAALLANA